MRIHLTGASDPRVEGLARLCAEGGHAVSVSDAALEQRVRTALTEIGIRCVDRFAAMDGDNRIDAIVIATSDDSERDEIERGGAPLFTPSEALRRWFLDKRRPLFVVGQTEGALIAALATHILTAAGLAPGYLASTPRGSMPNAALGSVRRRLQTNVGEGPVSQSAPFIVDGTGPLSTDGRRECVRFMPDENDAIVVAGQFNGTGDSLPSGTKRIVADSRYPARSSGAPDESMSHYAVEGDAAREIVPTWLGVPCKAELAGHIAFDLFVGGSSCGRFTLRSRAPNAIRYAVAAIAVCAEEFGVFPSAMRKPLMGFEGAV